MKINRKKIMYAILKELNDGNKSFSYKDFDVQKEEYVEIIRMLMVDGYAEGFAIVNTTLSAVFNDGAFILSKGINFIEDNSDWAKLYKGLKEFKSWIPGF